MGLERGLKIGGWNGCMKKLAGGGNEKMWTRKNLVLMLGDSGGGKL